MGIYCRIPERRADLDFALMCFNMAAAALFEGLSYQAVTIDGSEIIYVASSKPKKLASFWQILQILINQGLLKGNGDVMMDAASKLAMIQPGVLKAKTETKRD